MSGTHKAVITWSRAQIERGLPTSTETIDPAWFEAPGSVPGEGWSLMCTFDSPPFVQGSPSQAHVRFMVEEAPHDRLRQGTTLHMFERDTAQYAKVILLD